MHFKIRLQKNSYIFRCHDLFFLDLSQYYYVIINGWLFFIQIKKPSCEGTSMKICEAIFISVYVVEFWILWFFYKFFCDADLFFDIVSVIVRKKATR